MTVNQKTYDAITQNEFLQNYFSGSKVITTDAGENRVWTGCYLYGESTYIEFFPQADLNNLHNLGLGGTGIAFSVDAITEIKNLYQLFKKSFSEKIIFQTIPRKIEAQDVSWFDRLLLDHDSPRPLNLSAWIMAYHPEYLAFRDKLNTVPNTVKRQMYNKINYQQKLMQNITAVELTMDQQEYNKFSTLLKMINFQEKEFNFNINLTENHFVTINKIMFSLNKSVTKQTFTIGDSFLELDKNLGIWEF